MRKSYATSSAFTLVELLVVIGIIAVLISILLPSLARARESAQKTACMSQLRQFGQMITMYANDNRGLLPPPDPSGYESTSPGYPGNYLLIARGAANFMAHMRLWGAGYVSTPELFYCPSDQGVLRSTPGFDYGYGFFKRQVPSFGGCSYLVGSYAYNSQNCLPNFDDRKCYKVNDLARNGFGVLADNFCDQRMNEPFAGMAATPAHAQYYNILFADGHVVGYVDSQDKVQTLDCRRWSGKEFWLLTKDN